MPEMNECALVSHRVNMWRAEGKALLQVKTLLTLT